MSGREREKDTRACARVEGGEFKMFEGRVLLQLCGPRKREARETGNFIVKIRAGRGVEGARSVPERLSCICVCVPAPSYCVRRFYGFCNKLDTLYVIGNILALLACCSLFSINSMR